MFTRQLDKNTRYQRGSMAHFLDLN